MSIHPRLNRNRIGEGGMFNKPSVVFSISHSSLSGKMSLESLAVCPSGEATSEQPQVCLTVWPLHFCWLPQPCASPTWSPLGALLTITVECPCEPNADLFHRGSHAIKFLWISHTSSCQPQVRCLFSPALLYGPLVPITLISAACPTCSWGALRLNPSNCKTERT